MGIVEYIERKWPNYNDFTQCIINAYQDYHDLGLVDQQFIADFISGDEAQFNQRVWEMICGLKLNGMGFSVSSGTTKNMGGPDFKCKKENLTAWVEATCPTPQRISAHWLSHDSLHPKDIIAKNTVPAKNMLLRYTSAIDVKIRKFRIYIEKSIVSSEDLLIIAINGSDLNHTPALYYEGNSRYPLLCEAVWPVSECSKKLINHNGQHIEANFFTKHENRHISAIYGSVTTLSTLYGTRYDRTCLVHNPLACSPLPRKYLIADEEYVVENDKMREISEQ